jgi:adenylate cyclase
MVLLAALTLFLLFSPSADRLRYAVFDAYERMFPLDREEAPVVVVGIDEDALARYGQWPWPRTRIAQLIDRLLEHQPAAVGLDLFFPEPDRFSPAALASEMPLLPQNLARALSLLPSNDEQLAAAIRDHNVVLGIDGNNYVDPRFPGPPRAQPIVVSGDLSSIRGHAGYIGSVAVIDAAAAGRGLMNSGAPDQVVRIVPVVQRVQGTLVPSLGVETLRVALGTGLRLDDAPAGLMTLRLSDLKTRVQDDGTTWLRYAPYEAGDIVPASVVLDGKVNPELIHKKIVLVGITGIGLQDYKTTPLGQFVPGVTIHAQVVENLLNGVELTRPAAAVWIEAATLLVSGILLLVFVPRMSALQGIHVAFGLVVLIVGGGVLAFRHLHMLFDFAWPAIGTFAVFGSVVVGTLSEAERQRRQLRDLAARMAGEVDAARRIQMGLLPDPRDSLGDDRRFELAAHLEPARTVGGDFYECFMIDPRRLFVAVADVSGKGLPAALFMASVKSQIKSAALRGGAVGEMLRRAADEIARENPEQLFVTAFAGVLDVASGEFEYSNAGHEPPFVRSPNGSPERFGYSGGPPLCVVEDFDYPSGRKRFSPGEWMCLVTDGATEAMNPAKEFFGVERLRTSLSWLPDEVNAEDIIERLREDVRRFADGAEPADDITILALRWKGPV